MPAKYFICPDSKEIEISECLKPGGCRLNNRCATRPYLRLIGFDREWRGVSPSSAGNGPRLLYLKATTDYSIDPQDRVWAAFGTSTHETLGIHKYTNNVLSEEKLVDDEMSGIADVLEDDETQKGHFVITDYKTWGSFKVAKSIGIISESVDEPIYGDDGEPVLLKSGKNKGEVKTKKKTTVTVDPSKADLLVEEYQLNRYRIFFEKYGFPISKIQIQTVSRDGGTYIAKSRGVDKNIYIIPINRLPDQQVLAFYHYLAKEVEDAFNTGYSRWCNTWESWDCRRCRGFCEVSEACQEMTWRGK